MVGVPSHNPHQLHYQLSCSLIFFSLLQPFYDFCLCNISNVSQPKYGLNRDFNGDWQTSLFLFLLVLLVLTFLEDERATNHIFISTLLDLLRVAYTLLIFEAINLQIYVAKDMKATI